jgi:hypothetical protein
MFDEKNGVQKSRETIPLSGVTIMPVTDMYQVTS